jgi:hypothetical protein
MQSFAPAQIEWLRHNLPIFVQPTHDIQHGYGLIGVFVSFDTQTNTNANDNTNSTLRAGGGISSSTTTTSCYVYHVYHSEASYNRHRPLVLNRLGTWLYRSYNFHKFQRTADINVLVFRGIKLCQNLVLASDGDYFCHCDGNGDVDSDSDSDSDCDSGSNCTSCSDWVSIYTPDHGGSQTWSKGDKADLLCCYSFDHHYEHEIKAHEWLRHSDCGRILVYLNTSNHMIGHMDNNPELPKYFWHPQDYHIYHGDEHCAELYATMHIPVKCNALYCYPAASKLNANAAYNKRVADLRIASPVCNMWNEETHNLALFADAIEQATTRTRSSKCRDRIGGPPCEFDARLSCWICSSCRESHHDNVTVLHYAVIIVTFILGLTTMSYLFLM